jgi:hypothetical protein
MRGWKFAQEISHCGGGDKEIWLHLEKEFLWIFLIIVRRSQGSFLVLLVKAKEGENEQEKVLRV